MANAVVAPAHGFDYQARFFWIRAALLMDPDHPYVVEVSYEADGPKAFDDVVVRYAPGRPSTSAERIVTDYFQIKYHEGLGGAFGVQDLIDPAFIGAKSHSILERLLQAKGTAPPNSAFHLVTTARIAGGDPLEDLISREDSSLRLEKLFVKGADGSRMGRVRKLWREHLGLASDEDLRSALSGFHVDSYTPPLQTLREQVNLQFRVVGLKPCTNASAFTYDGAARMLVSRKVNNLTRDNFQKLCSEEGWLREDTAPAFRNLSIRSFSDHLSSQFEATPERTLLLTALFDGRWLKDGITWDADIKPRVLDFLRQQREGFAWVRLFLDAHQSIALFAGRCLGLKSGTAIEIVQKGRLGTTVWASTDDKSGPLPNIEVLELGPGAEIALAIEMTRDVLEEVQKHVNAHVPTVGKIIRVRPEKGPSQQSVLGGAHATQISEHIAKHVKQHRIQAGATVHVFASVPNALLFYLGQEQASLGPCQYYEYDFLGERGGGYIPAMRIP